MPDKELSLIEHLDELRSRIIYCLIPFVIAVLCSTPFVKAFLAFLRIPAEGVIKELAFFSPEEVAFVYMKIALFSGFILSLPVILYQIWVFISPAIAQRQKKYIVSFIFWAFFAFLCGCAFGYLLLVPFSLKFLIGLAGKELTPVIALNKYIGFVLALIAGCGIAFELPVVVWLLARLGIVNSAFLRKKRRYAIAIIFIAAAVITPTTDPVNMTLMALPMLVLYELSIWIARWNQRGMTTEKVADCH
ncbi:MAG: twin arginine-targeting protein translocase TatC [Omnitrophica WOR_2 bacterium GWC2_44_8]|nr:MAG: twin arginine-targeting protein translocase TatC [Omnitrophica WOR_2 bacterium GWC2_44_8]